MQVCEMESAVQAYVDTEATVHQTGRFYCFIISLQCVAYITAVGHYRIVQTALSNCGSTRITTVKMAMEIKQSWLMYWHTTKSDTLLCQSTTIIAWLYTLLIAQSVSI